MRKTRKREIEKKKSERFSSKKEIERERERRSWEKNERKIMRDKWERKISRGKRKREILGRETKMKARVISYEKVEIYGEEIDGKKLFYFPSEKLKIWGNEFLRSFGFFIWNWEWTIIIWGLKYFSVEKQKNNYPKRQCHL